MIRPGRVMPVVGDGDDVVEAFFAMAQRHPHRPAMSRHGRDLTYADVAAQARVVARRIGPRPGVVGVVATHSTATIAGLLGVWAAGGAYCPIDPAFPERRRRGMLAAAGCRLLLDPDLMRVDPLGPDGVEADAGEAADLAYILFTSGSTGEPKPVMTPRTAIAAVVASLRELFGITATDRVLQFASLNWDTCLEEILPALTSGACLVLHEDAYAGSFSRFLRMVDRERVSVLDLPTAFWHELVHHMREDDAALPASVRLVIIGGEAVSAARLADWCALKTHHARLLNTYGCTETTLITHAIDLHGPMVANPGTAARVPIGRPLAHVAEHIAENGELWIGGPALAWGYRGLPRATAAKFPHLGPDRFFRTGDRVSRLPDGALGYEGRIDDEVKIRGVRVDPAEVESHLVEHPDVGAAAVTGLTVADHTVLAAYVVPRSPEAAAGLGPRLLEYLRGRVPAHLVPNRVRVVDELSYTPSGKIDRRRIKEALP